MRQDKKLMLGMTILFLITFIFFGTLVTTEKLAPYYTNKIKERFENYIKENYKEENNNLKIGKITYKNQQYKAKVSNKNNKDLYFTKATDTTLRNIIYEIYEPKILFSDVYGTMVLDKITAEGSITFNNNNISAFISYTNWGSTAPCTVTFRECVNSVDFTDMGNNYGAPFVAFSSGDTDFVFDSCRNEGNLFYGNWASILIGNANPGQGFPKSVEIKNSFVNTGTISSFGTIAFCSHHEETNDNVIGKDLVRLSFSVTCISRFWIQPARK